MVDKTPLQIIASHQTRAPVDVETLAYALGLKIYVTELEQGVYGKLTRDNTPSGFAIYVNAFDADARRRFTVAHEIAHYVLHRDLINVEIVDREMYRSVLSSEYEAQANRLAAEILMPSDLIKSEFAKNNDLSVLAAGFTVSMTAMNIRLKGLGLQPTVNGKPWR
jgi:Zn-dependent peptidase ImmA (M78 family)